MRIAVITMWYNEAFLAPFFFSHYASVDKIYLILDQASTEDEDIYSICKNYRWVEIIPYSFPAGMDDELKIEKINYEASNLKDFDWVIAVDADEFIFAPEPYYEMGIKEFLSNSRGNVVYADMWQVYRHWTDEDLNPNKPPLFQRRHGDPNNKTGINGMYRKPCVVDPKVNIEWMPGCHSFKANNIAHISPKRLMGVHWAMADPKLAVKRRLQIKERQSENNLQKGLTVQNHHITRKEIIEQCTQHLNDPKLF